MKFGRYLADNATPEWKRAYIDYRAAKKAIKRVAQRLKQAQDPERRAEEGDGYQSAGSSDSGDDDHGPAKPRRAVNVSPALSASKNPTVTGPAAGATPPAGTVQRPGEDDGTSSSPPTESRRLKPMPIRSGPRSPGGYGAMGTSPRLSEGHGQSFRAGFSYGSGEQSPQPLSHHHHHHHHAHPPPLDIGEPTLEGRNPPTASESEEATTLVASPSESDDAGDRLRRVQRDRVNFSPVAQPIPETENDETKTSAETGVTRVTSDESTGTAKARVTSEDSTETAKAPILGTGRSPGSGVPKRSPSGFSPLRSLISTRVQASVGLSPSDMGDAPSRSRSIKSLKLPSPRIQPRTARTFDELYASLQPDEKAFFDLLDHELEKVEKFYSTQEGEALRRSQQLRDQLRELAEHRRVFHDIFPEGTPEWEAAMSRVLPQSAQKPVIRAVHLRNPFSNTGDEDHQVQTPPQSATMNSKTNGSSAVGSRPASANGDRRYRDEDKTRLARQYDPDRYQRYKKDLRIAMLSFYRHLELIKNFRVLNVTGFRKALKKFEKVSQIQCLELYTEDRIVPCSFSRGETIDNLLKETEDLFSQHFEHGNFKRAREKLRQQDMPATHYTSVFRSGIMLGLGIPAAILAIVKSFDPVTRVIIPAYSALLLVYCGLYIVVIFALLFEINLLTWVNMRINYEFIMELDPRPILDYRSYLEIPAFLFLTLSYCFLFSFYRVGSNRVAPTTWPAAWLVFVVAFFINPLPIMRRRSRYWLLKVLFRVLTPGYSRVEFIAFFVADELNSLVFSIQNIYFMSCAYAHKWPADTFGVCPSGRSWPYALLACLPALTRLIQCLKRYHDSNMKIHLINAGKYCSSIVTAILQVYWKSQGSPHKHASFIVYVIFATVSSIYTSSWDLVVDWALLRPHCKLLRPQLMYPYKSVYYFSMITNVLIRFIWVSYLPASLQHTHMRSWISAFLEMLRRWQWNFYRCETEHIGNADAYRVTVALPLPYVREPEESDDDPKGGKKGAADHSLTGLLRHIGKSLIGSSATGRGLDTLNIGAMGHAPQREYEGRRPGDGPGSSTSGDSAV